MRLLPIVVFMCLIIGCEATQKTGMNTGIPNGAWIPIQQEIGGKKLPAAAFEHQKLVMNDSTYTFTAESVDKGVVTCRDGKMDVYGKEGVNTGKHFTAIYKLENDQLTICYNLAGDGYPEIFETKGKPTLFLSIFKQEGAK